MRPERLSTSPSPPRYGGIDEAGRGPVIGPMVVVGVAVHDVRVLMGIGVRDSKKLTRASREALFDQILGMAEVVVLTIPAKDLDALMADRTLNEIEEEAFAAIIGDLPANTVVVDAVGPVDGLTRLLRERAGREVLARQRADAVYPAVSAASIVAKVLRDRAVDAIAAELGADIGSGYPSDPKTISFLERYVSEHGRLPPHTRARWATSVRLLNRRLGDFDG